jgi:hypothetical protein
MGIRDATQPPGFSGPDWPARTSANSKDNGIHRELRVSLLNFLRWCRSEPRVPVCEHLVNQFWGLCMFLGGL